MFILGVNRSAPDNASMAPGGNVYEDVTESCADYGVKSSLRSCGSACGRVRMASNSGVHELLKCMVCVTVMCPHIHRIFDGHNGSATAIYAKENLLNYVLGAIPKDLKRDEWVAVLPRALVAGFVKTDKDFQEQGFIFNDIAESSSTQAVSTVYKPQVAASMTPSDDMVFPSIDHAYEFYVTYAKNAGFSVRKGGDYKHGEILKMKYFVCSKEGFKTCKAFDSLEKGKSRNKPSQRTGCNAHIAFSSKDGKSFKVFRFVEEHNHYLVSPEDMQFLPSSRNLTYQQMQVLCNMSKVNMGPVKAFNVMRTIYGGFEQVGATAADFKNFKRDLNLYIGEYDADMVVNMLQKKKEFLPDFYFEYSHDTKRQLTGLFWADEHARRSYKVFGDVVSFDATFNSNKYKMVFVPFTGIDNHCNNITLGAGLLSSETIESYSWLLTCFKRCFGKEPRVVVTDQDPAIKQAVASVLPNSRHRLCMWHIMKKVADKVGTALCNNDDFKQRICDIVWTDSISPEEFEKGWEQLVFDFNLFYHDWLCDIYSNRAMWIPAFYRDEAMSGLMRTTSRSECENHFFGQVSNAQLTLLEFISHFDTAMESQRYTHRKNDHETRYKTPDFWTDYPIEVQAAKIYTRSIFFDVQEEIYGAVHKCINVFLSYEGDIGTFRIKDRSAYGDGLIEVKFNLEDLTILCPCKRFERYGLLCRHAFSVLRLCGINEIPSRYILDRWRSDVICNSPSRSSLSLVMHNDENGDHQSVNDVVRDIMQSSEYIVNKLITDFEKLKLFRDELKAMKEKTDEAGIQRISAKKKEIIQAIIGAPHQTEAAVRVPHGIRNKGCGSRKRFKSKREQAISRAGKRSRNCKVCGGSGHDRRTCDVLKGTVTANNKGKGPVNEADAENSSDSDYEAGDD